MLEQLGLGCSRSSGGVSRREVSEEQCGGLECQKVSLFVLPRQEESPQTYKDRVACGHTLVHAVEPVSVFSFDTMNARKARRRAQDAMLEGTRSGDSSWTCCDLICTDATVMHRHIAATHEDLLQQRIEQLVSSTQPQASSEQDNDGVFRTRRAGKYESDPINFDCSCDPSQGKVILFYAYRPISDPLELAKLHKSWSDNLNLYGKVRVSKEGINATLAGPSSSINTYVDYLTDLPDFRTLNLSRPTDHESDMDHFALEKRRYDFFKPTEGCGHVFGESISIKIVDEICPLGAPELCVFLDPENKPGKLPPKEFHQKLKEMKDRDDVVVLDVRNYYESTIGRFPGAITPPIRKFSSFRDYVDRNKELFSGKTVLSYCTGGIRW